MEKKVFKKKYKGFTIVAEQVNPDRVNYDILKANGEPIGEADGYCVTVEQAFESCEGVIDDLD